MIETFVSFISSILLIIIGFGVIFTIAILNKHEQFSGLSLVAIFDAIMAVVSGSVVLISILKTAHFCNVTDILFKNAKHLMPFIYGSISTMTWNYQCWNTIRSHCKARSRFKDIIISTLPQFLVSSLFLLGLLMFTPHKESRKLNENQFHCLPSTMLSYVYKEKCEVTEPIFDSYQSDIFNNFLQDTNKSISDLIVFKNNRINMSSGAEEIVWKIHKLVEETSTEANLSILVPTKQTESSFQDSDIIFSEIIQSLNTRNEDYVDDESIVFVDNYQSMNTSIRLDANNTVNLSNIIHNISLLENTTISRNTSNKNGENNDISVKNLISSDNSFQCHKKCSIKNHDERVYFIFLVLICYLVPTFGAIIFHYKAAMQVLIDKDDSARVKNDILLRSTRWAVTLPTFLLSPSLFCFFMEAMMCSKTPQWMPPVLIAINQVFSVLKNALNISVLKKYMSNQVYPLVEVECSDELASSSTKTPGTDTQ